MKSDINQLMATRHLDAYIVASDHNYNAVRDYLTNGARITGGYVLQQRDEPAVLIVNPMEIEEAATSGLRVLSYSDLKYHELVQTHKEDPAALQVAFWQRMLQAAGIAAGRVGVYGSGDLNVYVDLFRMLQDGLEGYELVGEQGTTLFDEAMLTKDADELTRIQDVAKRTSEVIALTWDYIASHRAEGEQVVDADGIPLTIGNVKRFIRRALLDRDLEDTGMIFAQGRDGGFPHSRGNDNATLVQGQAIVFDLFPREIGGGYHHDMTRTWSIGYATDAVQEAYQTVMTAFDIGVENCKPGGFGSTPQEAVLDFFEAEGHPTSRSHPGTSTGYVHSLGHGVGLKIHERPRLSHLANDSIQKGNVVTIEPGLYYPDAGYGVRIEDMLYIAEDGSIVTLTDFHKELVIPLSG